MTGHCFRCGAAFESAPPTVCRVCHYEQYNPSRPTGGLVIVNESREFLAVKRARPPKAGLWELPGGFCDAWESPADAAVREGREELGVEVELGPLLLMQIGEYEFQDELLPVLDIFFEARLRPGQQIVLDPHEATEWAWFPLDSPPELAFETMAPAIAAAAERG